MNSLNELDVKDLTSLISHRVDSCILLLDNLEYLASAYSGAIEIDVLNDLVDMIVESLKNVSSDLSSLSSKCQRYKDGVLYES